MDFILKDIEQATNLLPEQQTGVNLGRATKGAAKALKARLLLHVASPLFADRTVNKLECNQYTGDRQALYQQALDAAKDVINDSNYSLIDCNAGTIKEIAEKFHNIIITNNEETIWSKQYVNKDLNADNWVRNRVALLHGPNGYHNWAGTAPVSYTHLDVYKRQLYGSFHTRRRVLAIPGLLCWRGWQHADHRFCCRSCRYGTGRDQFHLVSKKNLVARIGRLSVGSRCLHLTKCTIRHIERFLLYLSAININIHNEFHFQTIQEERRRNRSRIERLRRGVRYADPRVLPGGNGCAVRYHQPQYIERYGVVQTDA